MKLSYSPDKISYVLVGIFLLALILRVWGCGFGLPYEYHVDENQYVRQAATMGESGLKPADWYNPPLFKYILLAEYGFMFVIGKILGFFTSAADFGARLTVDPTWLYLPARWTSALMGSLTCITTYWIGNKAYNRRVGLISAIFMTVSFLAVRESHFAVNDAAVALWISLALFASVGILKSGDWRWYLLGGISVGLGFATKYNSLSILPTLLLAHLFSPGVSIRTLKPEKLFGFGLTSLFTALLFSPYFLLDAKNVWHDVYRLIWSGQYGFEGWQIDPVGGYLFYLKTLGWGLGWLMTSISILGILFAIFRHKAVDILLISFPILLYLYLGGQNMFFGRFMLPVLPPLAVITAALLDGIISRVAPTGRANNIGLIAILIILISQPLINSIRFDILLTQQDTRTIAKEWMEQNIPGGSRIAMDWQFHLSTSQN